MSQRAWRGMLGAVALLCAVIAEGCSTSSLPSSSSGTTTGNGTGSGSSIATGTLHIVATEGPTCPVQRQGAPPCVAPYQGKLAITTSTGVPVAEVSTRIDGTVDVQLVPGTYTVNVPGGAGVSLPRLQQPVTVEVIAGSTVTATLSFDTGIR